MVEDFTNVVNEKLEEALEALGQVNVLIAGKTGVGKSTLINAVFQGNMAETGSGRPVTRHVREISKEGIPLTIWDTRGLEVADFGETLGELERLVDERSKDTDPTRHIHVAWLCIQEDGRRVEPAEIELHKRLSKYMPVIAVITKARADEGFRATVQELLPECRTVVRVRAIGETLDDGHVIPPMGLEELVDATMNVVPDGQKNAFAAAQKASIDQKVKRAQKIVATAAGAAAAVGATPIPFSDAVALVPIQIGMLASISGVFGLGPTRAFLATIVGAAAGSTGATFVGRALVLNALKFVPGANVAAAAIAGTTAAALTTALGTAYISTLKALAQRVDILGAVSHEAIAEEFRKQFAKEPARA